MDVTPAENTQPNHRRMNLVKVALGCSGLTMLLCSGIVMLGIILTPIAFRSLSPENQERFIRKFPFLKEFKPTPAHSLFLPTIAATSADAVALLGTPVVTETKTPTPVLATNTPQKSSLVTPTLVVAQISPTPVPTNIPSPTEIPAPVAFHSPGFQWIAQGWNNCGPANITQVLRYYGWQGDQDEAASYLKPNRNDKNVSPSQMVDFVNSHTGVKGLWRVAGTLQMIKRLVSQGFGVIMETGYDVADEGWMGHYLTVIGYDDTVRLIYGLDTYLGEGPEKQGFHEDYDDLDRRWQAFNRTYIVVYTQEREGELAAILGPDADLQYNAFNALSVARTEASMQPRQPWPWFNMGSSFTMLEKYKEAAAAFDQAQSVDPLPYRMLWYQFAPYEAYYNVGNYAAVIALATSSLNTTTDVEETYYWRAMAYAAQGKSAMAIEDFKRATRLNPNFSDAAKMLEKVQSGTFSAPVIAQARQ